MRVPDTDHAVFTSEDLVDHDALGAVILDENDRVLVLDHQKWGFTTIPLGKAHIGQSPIEGLCEEMEGELGIRVTEATSLKVEIVEYRRRRKPISLRMHLFRIDAFEGDLTNLEPIKHARLRFASLDEVARLKALSDATLLMLDYYGRATEAPWTGKRFRAQNSKPA